MWTSNGNGLRLTQSMVEEEDINLLNRDVLTEVVDGLPLIQFLEKVQALIHKSIDKTIVIKLLGRQIGFNVLLNKINALWDLGWFLPVSNDATMDTILFYTS
ncbi:hypothetical protein Goshw_025338 [Gossypium schwendimanii]|uniref:Uncharacterized protein n=1 Tax=Gossypium schwendimanii TaxID=34291 RepID=A0A7J9LCF0_GOSSC|nr:hypothetical protein [Gossypium schwendimanii]